MTKYIFVSGGVVSSVGKGITVASLGRILKGRGITVSVQKLDPYLNVDPGTMSPFQHGEVFVTDDGAETDLDLGHYERFIDVSLTRSSNVTAGQIYKNVIGRERRGDYLGGTIQVIPHITNEIKERITRVAKQTAAQVVIVEVGGTVGDIESLPFLEAIRQMRRDVGESNTLFIHLTLLPYIASTQELKTKPTQHSVKELLSIGIQPDIIVCRSDYPVSDDLREKIALFCNVEKRAVVPLETVSSIYQVPLVLEESGLGDFVVEKLGLGERSADLAEWRVMVNRTQELKYEVEVGVVGKYVDLHDSYLSVREALFHAALHEERRLKVVWIDSEQLEKEDDSRLKELHGIVVPGGFGYRGVEGMIRTARYAREHDIPYLGLCLGMQIMVIELARHVLGSDEPNSTEFNMFTPHPVIDLLPEQRDVPDKGGTMRLGQYPCQLIAGTRAADAYGTTNIVFERHRHRYEFNNDYRELLGVAGLSFSGLSPDGRLVEISELAGHPWMLGTQFHPEFKSRPNRPHPLFSAFIRACKVSLREGDQRPLPLEKMTI
ncbi:MAG: CTP synthase [Actinobacteria bacterium]|nr:CTP synthase [Actinomycetota bacterium]